MARSIFCVAAVVALLCQTGAAETGTPIARVISLLGKLETQIGNEGKKEAAEYDKFACYCKEQADDTLYAIETSKEKISVLTADLKKLDADIKETEGDIKTLEGTIKTKETNMKNARTKRGNENKAYKATAEEIADAIGAIEDAIKALKDKKAGVKDGKMNFLQDQLLGVLSRHTPTESQRALVQALAPADPAANHAYTYKSNDIISTLDTLLKQFKEKKKDANVDEKELLFAFDEKFQLLENERNFADKDRIQKVSTLAELKTDHADKTKDKEAEDTAMKADQAYLDEVTADCESKAAQFDQRSSTRSDELTALGKAMDQLKGGVSSNYGSNALSAASFLQIRRNSASESAVVAQAAALVSMEAERIKSASLTGLALKLSMGGGFGKVVKLIKDLIKKLEDEAKAAASSKGQCDSDMEKAVAKRDKNKLEMEDQTATIAMKGAEKNKLGGEVEKLSAEIAELQKAKLEATELRSEEKSDNEAVIAESKEGKEAIDTAIKVLNDFYGAQLLQVAAAPAKNRDGESTGDAPKLSYDGDYKGKQGASKGIIGILEVIQSDFARTISNVKGDETQAASDFKAFETKTTKDVADKGKLKKEKEDNIKKAASAITAAKDDLIDADKLMNAAMEELEKVTAMCMTGEGTFAERKKQREDEIKALKGAQKILEDWKA